MNITKLFQNLILSNKSRVLLIMEGRQIQPFQFKSKNKNRFNEKSFKFLRRKNFQQKKDKKKLRRTVRLRRIHLNHAISVRYKGCKWWQKMMQIYFPEVTEEDIISCAENTTSDIILFIQPSITTSSYNELITFTQYPQISEKDTIRVIFRGYFEEDEEQSSDSENRSDILELITFKFKLFPERDDVDECYIADPQAKIQKPSKKFPAIKFKNIKKQLDRRAEYRANAKLQYNFSTSDQITIMNSFTYHQRFIQSNYSHINCEQILFPKELEQVNKMNKQLWKIAHIFFLQEKQSLEKIKTLNEQIPAIQMYLACRNRLLYFKKGFGDKTEDQLEQALEEMELQGIRLHFSRGKKEAQLASYNDCKICFNPEVRQDNPIIFCSFCKMSFHYHCYGLKTVQKPEYFLCDSCLFMETHDYQFQDIDKRPECQICYSKPQFPLKQISNRFFHPSCLFLFGFIVPSSLPIELKENAQKKINKHSRHIKQDRCQYCVPHHIFTGMRFQCQVEKCRNVFHPICGYLRGSNFIITRDKKLKVKAVCAQHTYGGNQEDQIRQVFLRRFFCNYDNIQKLNEEEFKPLYRQEKQEIILEKEKCIRKHFDWSQYEPPSKKRKRQQYQAKKVHLQNPNLSIQQILSLFTYEKQAKIQEQEILQKSDDMSTYYFGQEDQKQQNTKQIYN